MSTTTTAQLRRKSIHFSPHSNPNALQRIPKKINLVTITFSLSPKVDDIVFYVVGDAWAARTNVTNLNGLNNYLISFEYPFCPVNSFGSHKTLKSNPSTPSLLLRPR